MRIVFIGAVEFSERMLKRLIELKAEVAGVLTKRESPLNADFVDLSDIARQNNIPFKYAGDINSQDNIEWIERAGPDIIFCFGFSQILKKGLLNISPMGAVDFHPAKLPENRGRHPIPWTLILGLEKTASTFFFLDDGIDRGDILSQVELEVTYQDNARSLYGKLVDTASGQIEELLPKLQRKTFDRTPQDDAKAIYWRKRNKEDGKIDFRMSGRAIYNLIRGLTTPYAGAHLIYQNKEIKTWEAEEAMLKADNVE